MSNTSYIVTGCGNGDERKGGTVDHLAKTTGIKNMVRDSGGGQAAHHVVLENGTVHCFSHFCSGLFRPGTRSILSKFMAIDPVAMLREAKILTGKGIAYPLSRSYISKDCPIVTPMNMLINRIRELSRGSNRHGSCGKGIGVTLRDAQWNPEQVIRVEDLRNEKKLRQSFETMLRVRIAEARGFTVCANYSSPLENLIQILRDIDVDAYVKLYVEFARHVRIIDDKDLHAFVREGAIFEGSQGVLLDQDYGFYPHVTWTRTTGENAMSILRDAGCVGTQKIIRLGVLRAYHTRHGDGPFVSESRRLTEMVPELHNTYGPWQGPFRCGWFDLPAARYATSVAKVDALVITNLDRLVSVDSFTPISVCTAYEMGNGQALDGIGGKVSGERPTGEAERALWKEKRREHTKLLLRAKPVLDNTLWKCGGGPIGAQDFANAIANRLELPLFATTFGPTASDTVVSVPL